MSHKENWRTAGSAGFFLSVLFMTLLASSVSAGLRYELSAEKREYSPGDRIQLHGRLINEEDRPVVIYWREDHFHDQLILDVKGADGKGLVSRRGYELPPISDFEAKYLREIPAGEAWEFNLDLEDRYIIRIPGTYTVSSAYSVYPDSPPDAGASCWTGRVEAEPVVITLSEERTARRGSNLGGTAPGLGTTVIEGRVLDPNGKPVQGTMVHVWLRRWVSNGGYMGLMEQEIDRAETDSKGSFAFAQLPDDCSMFILSCPGVGGGTEKIVVPADPPRRRLSATIELHPPDPEVEKIQVRGVVQDSRGRPIRGARVCARGHRDEECRTDDDGIFDLETLPREGRIHLSANKTGYPYREYTLPVDSVKAGPVTLVLNENDEAGATGRIRFQSGRSVKDLNAEFSLKDRDGDYGGAAPFRAERDGRFELTLHRDGDLSGKARFSFGRLSSDDPQPRWWTEIEGLRSGMDDAEIVINDTGSIEVDVETLDPPEKIGNITVRLGLLDAFLRDRYESIGIQEFGPEGGQAVFEGLCPGEYQVEVKVPGLDDWRWFRKLTLAEEGGRLHRTERFLFPDIGYGSVRGRCVCEDGEVPAFFAEAEIRPPGRRFRRQLEYDGEGGFWADEVLSGTCYLTINAGEYGEWHGYRLIERGKTTDLGVITLRRTTRPASARGRGRAAGRLLYDDGTPVLGPFSAGFSNEAATDADGGFALDVYGDSGFAEFNLSNTKIWPGAYVSHGQYFGSSLPHRVSGDGWHGAWWEYSMVARFEIEPGETATRDLVIPCTNLSPIRFRWLGNGKSHLRVGCFSSADSRQFRRHGEFYATGDLATDIAGVRPGEKVVTVRTDDFFGYVRFASGETDLEAVFDSSRYGSIAGLVLKSDGAPNAAAKVYACAADLEVSGSLRWSIGDMLPFVDILDRPWPALSCVQTDAKGRFEFRKVSPGRYFLCVDQDGETTVEVIAGEKADVQFVSDHLAWNAGPPALREPGE